jgi:hypothetical protein
VYKKEKPNRFLAQLVPFINQQIADNYCKKLVENSMNEFVERNISQYSDFKEQPISFVGSVAFHFSNQLKYVAKKHHLKLGDIVKDPMNGLIQYYQNLK